jgi:hypothetical protein
VITAGQESLDLLAFVDRAPSHFTSPAPIPSWVPDWRVPQAVKISNRRCFDAAKGRIHQSTVVMDDLRPIKRCLSVKGYVIDRISYVATCSFYSAKPWESRDLCAFLNSNEHLVRLMRYFGTSLGKPKQVLERLLRVVLADGSASSISTLHLGKSQGCFKLTIAMSAAPRCVAIHLGLIRQT